MHVMYGVTTPARAFRAPLLHAMSWARRLSSCFCASASLDPIPSTDRDVCRVLSGTQEG
jgi:hypothetical protein